MVFLFWFQNIVPNHRKNYRKKNLMSRMNIHLFMIVSRTMTKFISNKVHVIDMKERLEKSIKNSLRGKFVHLDPLKALEGLSADTARRIPEKSKFSCWHFLYHIVFWQDLMLGALRKESVNWPENNESSWPTAELLKKDADWDALVEKFENGLAEADGMTESIDSMEDLPAWPKVPPFAAYLILIQHNSYHIGELIATRQALGFWPPPDYKATF
ncbi:MAG: DinB family protein [Candidatus Thorarchaeota archaeon]|nr:MAG: DinB family protein [Candidatus Thorarchaeota archaeon]